MANPNVDQSVNGYVSFVTSSDEGSVPVGHAGVPGLVVHPEADAVNLWAVAEARLRSLDKMLSMFAEGVGAGFDMADFAEVVQPRVQEILTLASTGNDRANLVSRAPSILN